MYRKVRPVTREAVVHTPAGDALALSAAVAMAATAAAAAAAPPLRLPRSESSCPRAAAARSCATRRQGSVHARVQPTRRTRTLPGWATAHTQLRAGAEEGGCGAPGCLVSTAGQAARREAAGPPFFLLRDESEPERQAPSFLIYILEFRTLAKVLAPGFVRYRPYLSVRFSDETRKRRNVRN